MAFLIIVCPFSLGVVPKRDRSFGIQDYAAGIDAPSPWLDPDERPHRRLYEPDF
jgi:hypothetical protein